MRKLLHALYDRLIGRNHTEECDFGKMDEKIARLRKEKHELASRTDVIQYEAYMGRQRRLETANDDSSSP